MAEPASNVHPFPVPVAQKAEGGPPLKDGDGDGTSGGMESRIAALEAHMEHVRDDLRKLAGVPADLAALKVKVDHLPGKGFVVGSSLTAITLITALLIMLQRIGVLH